MTRIRTNGLCLWCIACCLAATLLAGALASADAPPGRYKVTAETVFDTRTDLTWQRLSGPLTIQADAIDYCEDLVLGGYRDWRLPNMAELLSIVDVTRFDPAIDGRAFPDTPSGPSLSSSPFSPMGRCVDFKAGATRPCHELIPDGSAYLRCVR
jgi:hypothetical protein